MENVEYCFCCCKYIPKEDYICDPVNLEDSFISNNYETNTCETEKSKSIKAYLLQISHFLKVPREVIKEDQEILSSVRLCLECTEISRNLSDLCVKLEVIQMKISHFLNLLTDQIIGFSTEQDEERRARLQPTYSNLQRLVHKRCLLKVRKDEETSSPQIRLEKCQIPIQKDLPEALTADIKLEINPMNSCPFCDLVSSGQYEIIHSHIETTHPEQIRIEPKDKSVLSKAGEPKSSKAEKCTKCGKILYSRDNLNRHLKESLTCGRGFKRKPPKIYKNRYECSNCRHRYNRRENLKRHLRTICKNGMFIDHGPKDHEIYVPPPKYVTEKQTKFPCNFCPIIFNNVDNQQRHIQTSHVKQKASGGHNIKACEYCGVMMGTGNLRKHKKNVHGIGKFGPDPNLVKKYERCVCGKIVNAKNMEIHKIKCKGSKDETNEKLGRSGEVKQKKPRKKYYYEKKPPVKCEICEKIIGYRNYSAHKTKVHGMNLYRW